MFANMNAAVVAILASASIVTAFPGGYWGMPEETCSTKVYTTTNVVEKPVTAIETKTIYEPVTMVTDVVKTDYSTYVSSAVYNGTKKTMVETAYPVTTVYYVTTSYETEVPCPTTTYITSTEAIPTTCPVTTVYSTASTSLCTSVSTSLCTETAVSTATECMTKGKDDGHMTKGKDDGHMTKVYEW